MLIRAALVVFLLVGALVAQQTPAPGSASSQQPGSTQPAASAKISVEKEADIRRLLEVPNVSAIAKNTMDGMQTSMRPILLQALPAGEYRDKLINLFFERFRAKANPQQIIDLAIGAYDQHFTDDEIKGLIKFYETPLGKKTIAETPLIMTELQQRGREWGQNIGREAMQEVLAEHPDLDEAMKSAAASTKLP